MIAYKDSGIKWLGKIPAHWEMVRNSLIFTDLKEVVGENSQNYTLLSLTKQGIIPRDMESGKGKFPAEFNTYKIVNPNNLVFCLFDIDETPRTVGISNNNGMVTGAYNVFSIQNADPRYIYYYYLSIDDKKALKPYYTSLRKVINLETFMSIRTPLPPLEEQKKIADFLDKKLEKIDYFIAKQTKFIELLKEQKQVLINQATTKGLDKSTELKDTHISHLGKIPTNWEITKIGKVATQITDGSHFTPDYVDDGVPFISVKDISNGFIDFSDTKFISEKEYQDMKFRCNPEQGDLLLSKIGTICSPAIVETNKPFNIFVSVALLKLNISIINNKYLYYLCYCNFVKKQALLNTEGVGNKNWVLVKIRETIIVLPPLEEQRKIAKYLDDKCEKIDKVINNITKQISLIQEYKTSLIDTTTKGMLKELK